MTYLHIATGALALLAGFVALFSAKGGHWHRLAGRVFVGAMLLMGGSGALLAALKPVRISVVAGLLVIYLVATALLCVRRRVDESRGWLAGLMLLAVLTGALGWHWGLLGLQGGHGELDGYPAAAYLLFGSIALLGAGLDLRLLHAGAIQGKHRLARHLWRMGMALYLATSAFFLGQAKLFPPSMQHTELLAAPVLTVVLVVAYWLVRTLRGRRPSPVNAAPGS